MKTFKDFFDFGNDLSHAYFVDDNLRLLGDDIKSKIKQNNQIVIFIGDNIEKQDFILDNIIKSHGHKFDIKDTQEAILKVKSTNYIDSLCRKFISKTGRYMESLELSDIVDIDLLKYFLEEENIQDDIIKTFVLGLFLNKYKANVNFNLSLHDIDKLQDIYEFAKLANYDIDNIHIIFYLNDEIKTYLEASKTIEDIMAKVNDYRKFFNGEMWFITDKNEDSFFYLDVYTAFKVKSSLKDLENISYVQENILSKLDN